MEKELRNSYNQYNQAYKASDDIFVLRKLVIMYNLGFFYLQNNDLRSYRQRTLFCM